LGGTDRKGRHPQKKVRGRGAMVGYKRDSSAERKKRGRKFDWEDRLKGGENNKEAPLTRLGQEACDGEERQKSTQKNEPAREGTSDFVLSKKGTFPTQSHQEKRERTEV